MQQHDNFEDLLEYLEKAITVKGYLISTEKWQGIKLPQPMVELFNISFSVPMYNDFHKLNSQIKPNQPWADKHFRERVGGKPLNPGETYKIWPFYKMDKEMRTENEKFSHTYMERFWPKLVDGGDCGAPLMGLRYELGDLDDLANLLVREPLTRQAFLPVWFPEDTGVCHKGRVPCTIGYHFIMRFNKLHVIYYIRSCDIIRHLRDDIYLAISLADHILRYLQKTSGVDWEPVTLGTLTMHITSLHCFQSDIYNLNKKWRG